MNRQTLAPLLALVLLLGPVAATAKLCGDDVDGQDVPCACGDIVVSNLSLADDPVTQTACAHNGLVVRAPSTGPGVTIDLHGHTLRGTGHGAGLLVLSGGQSGARVVSSPGRATLTAFQDGLVSHGAPAVVLIDGVVALGNRRDGVRVEGGVYEIRNTETQDSGRDGFSVTGRNYQLNGTRALHSKRNGYAVMGQGGTLGAPGAGSVSEQSGAAGFSLMGMGHRLIECVARSSGKAGVHLAGGHYEIRACTATGNGGDGISGMGMDWRVADNQAVDNGNNGIVVSGPGVVDAGGNRGSGNRGQRQRRPVAQCAINHQPCQP